MQPVKLDRIQRAVDSTWEPILMTVLFLNLLVLRRVRTRM